MATQVRIEGLNECVRSLKNLGVEAQDLRDAFYRAGEAVTKAARPKTNPMTGRLAASIRSAKQQRAAVVRAGGARIPYAGVQHFGGYNNIKPKFYLTQAAEEERENVLNIIGDGLDRLIKEQGLA